MLVNNIYCKIAVLWIAILFSAAMQPAKAITEQEYEVLTELSKRLDELYPLIVEGKANQLSSDRILIDWDILWEEVMIIQQGVLESFEPLSIQARSVPLLAGDYLQ